MVSNFSFIKKNNGNRNLIHFHGFTACKEAYPLLQEICHEHGINYYGLDFPGQGNCEISETDKPTMEYLVDYAIKFIESLNLDSFILSGHSMGGAIAVMVAAKLNTKKIEFLLLEDPVNPGLSKKEVDSIHGRLKLQVKYSKFINGQIELVDMDSKRKLWYSQLADSMCSSEFLSNLKLNYNYSNYAMNVLFGELDMVVNVNSSFNFFLKIRKVNFEKIDLALHSPHIENPTEYREKVEKFLK